MNYITTPDGVKRPFRFSWKSLRRLANELGVEKLQDLATQVGDLPLSKIPAFIFIGFEQGAKREGIEIDFTAATVEDWLDDKFALFQEAMEAFARDFGASLDEGNAQQAKGKK